MNEALIQRIQQCPSLPSIPAIAMQILELAQKADVDIAAIARTITKDAALSSKILRTVNSSFYSRSHKISTISHALVILGLQSVKTLVLGFSLVSTLPKGKTKGFAHVNYWKRSIYAATAARTLSGRLHLAQQEESFLASLLMDLGTLVLDQVLEEEYGLICSSVTSHIELAAAEANILKTTHAEVTGYLANQWKFPPLLATPMEFHHHPELVEDLALRKLTQIASIAGRCADVFVEEDARNAIRDTRAAMQENFQINADDCDHLLAEIGQKTREVAPLFDINLGTVVNYDAILKKANDTLVELTLRSQQQAANLQEQNQVLKVQATTDELTGLANRASFNQFLQQAFAEAGQARKPLALVMLDVDHFKSVNDKHGHLTGDHVLRTLGRLVKAAAKGTMLAARYGGEEIALVLPDCTRAGATQMAETIRRAICARPLPCGSMKLPVSASFGVAVFDPLDAAFPLREATQLIKATDLALYAAKNGGRNCVRVFTVKSPTTQAA